MKGTPVWTTENLRARNLTEDDTFKVEKIHDSGWLTLKHDRTGQVINRPAHRIYTKEQLAAYGILK